MRVGPVVQFRPEFLIDEAFLHFIDRDGLDRLLRRGDVQLTFVPDECFQAHRGAGAGHEQTGEPADEQTQQHGLHTPIPSV